MIEMDFQSILQTTAVISTVIQFLSGSVICRNYFKKKSVGDSSGFPFICGFLSCAFWLRYGLLIENQTLILVNSVGTFLFLVYTFVYNTFTVQKLTHLKQFAITLIALAIVITYTRAAFTDLEYAIKFMGVTCCIVTVCFFAAPLTNLMLVIRTKNSQSLPLPLIATSFLVSLQWLIYGIIIRDPFVQLPNFLGCLLSISQLSLFVIYPPKSFQGHGYKLLDQAIIF